MLEKLASTEAAKRAVEEARQVLEAQCDEVEGVLTRVRKQQAEEAEAFAAELRKREEELGAVLLDSRSKSALLAEALASQSASQAKLQAGRTRWPTLTLSPNRHPHPKP